MTVTPFGVPFTKAPESEFDAKTSYDERIDVWCVGVFYFILLTNRMMFEMQQNSYKKTEWSLETDRSPLANCMHVSLEGIKFIDDVVRFDFKDRPKA